MKNLRIIGILTSLVIVALLMSACTNSGSQSLTQTATPIPTSTSQTVPVTITVTPTETTILPIQTVTSTAVDPVIGKNWSYDYQIKAGTYLREATMFFVMDEAGKIKGTISSKSGTSASITGVWYIDSTTGIYYLTPISCMSLNTDWGEVIGPAREQVRWDMNAPDIPGKDNPYHWCRDPGVIYEMKYLHPNRLVEWSLSNTRAATDGVTFITN